MNIDLWNLDFFEGLANECNGNEQFREATAFADSKIVFSVGSTSFYWKIYKSKIIDIQPFIRSFDPLGYDVILRAEPAIWTSIAQRRTKVWDHYNGFELEIGGNHLEAHRLHEALLIVCQDILPAYYETKVNL